MWQVGAFKKSATKYNLLFRSEVDTALRHAADFAKLHTKTKSEFKRRSALNSVKDSTSWRFLKFGKNVRTVRLSNPKPYARILEFGSKPHIIRARRRKYLRFSIGKRVFFRKQVFHPGTKPYKFFENAGDAAIKELERDLSRRLIALGRRRL